MQACPRVWGLQAGNSEPCKSFAVSFYGFFMTSVTILGQKLNLLRNGPLGSTHRKDPRGVPRTWFCVSHGQRGDTWPRCHYPGLWLSQMTQSSLQLCPCSPRPASPPMPHGVFMSPAGDKDLQSHTGDHRQCGWVFSCWK
jgi:hypothetical protein